ncbi:Ig-like domain-containing protein [Staphylococcus gallinarum]|uniref:Ig-like domain-containing protein n=1 Tax=Staphylococcus gallinarum TaxID=1293 RepID=UPI003174BE41
MVKTLNVYKGSEVVASQEGDGRTSVTISNLKPDTTYTKGEFQVSWAENGRESDKVDVPEFRTKPILVNNVTFSSESVSIDVGNEDVLTANIAPSTATNQKVKYTSDHPEIVTVDQNTGAIHGITEGTAIITATAQDSSQKTGQITINVVQKA